VIGIVAVYAAWQIVQRRGDDDWLREMVFSTFPTARSVP